MKLAINKLSKTTIGMCSYVEVMNRSRIIFDIMGWIFGLCMYTISSFWHICITMCLTDKCGFVLFWFTCHYFAYVFLCYLTGGQNVPLHYVWNNYVIPALSLPSLWRPFKNSGLMPEAQWDAHIRIWKEGNFRQILGFKINVCLCKTLRFLPAHKQLNVFLFAVFKYCVIVVVKWRSF